MGKREEKEEKRSGIKSPKKKKKKKKKRKKKSMRIFLFAVVIFGPIRNTLFRVKQTLSTFILMQDIIDEQIRWLSRAKYRPHLIFCSTSKTPWQS